MSSPWERRGTAAGFSWGTNSLTSLTPILPGSTKDEVLENRRLHSPLSGESGKPNSNAAVCQAPEKKPTSTGDEFVAQASWLEVALSSQRDTINETLESFHKELITQWMAQVEAPIASSLSVTSVDDQDQLKSPELGELDKLMSPQVSEEVIPRTTSAARLSIPCVPMAQSGTEKQARSIHLDDAWTEVFFLSEKEAEDALEKIYLQVRQDLKDHKAHQHGDHISSASHGTTFGLDEGWKIPVLHPTSRARVTWDTVGMTLLVYDLAVIPIQFAWNMVPHVGSLGYIMALVCMGFWTLDILVTFMTASYSKSGKLHTSMKNIALTYARKWLAIDVGLVSFDYIMLIVAHTQSVHDGTVQFLQSIHLLRLIRLAKLVRLARVFEHFCVTNGKQTLALSFSVCKIAFNVLAMLHMFGCVIYFVGRVSEEAGQRNWVSTYFDADDKWEYRYLKSVHFMLCQYSPAPFPWAAQNVLEQSTLMVLVLVGLPLIGSSLSRLMALVTQMNAKADENRRMVDQFEQYIMHHKVPPELTSKVLLFVSHKLKQKSKEVSRPAALSLLPPDMSVELTLAQVGQALMIHPFIALIMDAQLSNVSELCAAFNLNSLGPQSEVFCADTSATCMHVTSTGTYALKPKSTSGRSSGMRKISSGTVHGTVDPRDVGKWFDQPQWFAELSLFTKFTHTGTLFTKTFAEVYSISSIDFAHAIKCSPISTVAAFEYANSLLAKVNREEVACPDSLPQAMCVEAVTSTQLSEAVFPGRQGNNTLDDALSKIPGRSGADDWKAMQEFLTGLLGGEKVDDTKLQEMLPELHSTAGTYYAFNHMDERKNCVLGILSAIWLKLNNYDAITSNQNDAVRLQHITWNKLQSFVKWVDLDLDMLHGVLVFLSIRGLGKSKLFNHMCPPPARSCPEYGVAYAMKNMANIVPSVELLPKETYYLVKQALLLNKDFNFGQFIQGENIPYSVSLLAETVAEHGEKLLKFYLFAMVCTMSGLTGKVSLQGSLFLTDKTATNLLNGINCLQSVGSKDPQQIYWSYIRNRAQALSRKKVSTREELTFARMLCLTRAMDQKGRDILEAAWCQLEPHDKAELVNWFTADGISVQALTMTFLPNYFSNAIANPLIGLHFAFLNLLDLLDRLEDHMDKAQAKAYTIDIAAFAALTADVATSQGLCEVIKTVKIVRKDTKISLVLTNECRQAVSKTAYKRVRDRTRGEASVDAQNLKWDGTSEVG